jgi:Zn-finger nucleic acid-binding protein
MKCVNEKCEYQNHMFETGCKNYLFYDAERCEDFIPDNCSNPNKPPVEPELFVCPLCGAGLDSIELITHNTAHCNNCAGYIIVAPEVDRLVFSKSKTADPVNHPDHYQQYPIEVIDMIRSVLGPEGFKSYCLGNEIKYRMRAGFKGDQAEDIGKAIKYAEFRRIK